MKYAFIVFNHCAIWQVTLLQKFLKEKEWEMKILSVDGLNVSTDGGMIIHVDGSIENALPQDYVFILMPGGEITASLMDNLILHAFLRDFNGIIAASCSSAVLLAAAGLINGKFTSMPHIVNQYSTYFKQGQFLNTDVCVSENIITSKGFAHYEFMIEILKILRISVADPRIETIALKLSRNASKQ